MRQVVILAGGKGTRLGDRLGDLPKPMMDVVGRPLLEHQLELARRHGFTEAVLFTGYRAEAIEEHFGDGARLGMRLVYCREEQPLGTAGAVMAGRHLLAERFLVMYGDTMVDVDLGRLWEAHAAAHADVTLFLHPNDHPQDSDLVETDAAGRVRAFHPYPHPADAWLPNRVNAALYVMERAALPAAEGPPRVVDFAKHLFPQLLARGAHLHGYDSPEYIKDMGTPERYDRVVADVRAGKLERRSLRAPQPAVFLDRDGTLIEPDGYIRTLEQVRLLPGVGPALRRLNRAALRAVVVTNQPVLARGELTEDGLARLHAKLETLLGREGAFLDRIYHCPHHPDRGFPGEVPALKVRCECRKPAAGMLRRAAAELSIDLARSWLVGDSTVDVLAARAAGVRSVLVRTGEAGGDGRHPHRPDYVLPDVAAAVEFILEGHPRLREALAPLAARVAPGAWVGVGGLAHAGKSSAASALRELLAERGLRAHVLSLDAFIRSAAERTGPGLEAAHDLEALGAAVAALRGARQAPVRVQLPRYDRARRQAHPDGEVLEVGPGDVLVLEGVTALEAPALSGALDLRVYVDCPEPLRRERFLRDYAWRGVDADAAARLYAEREADEHPRVRAGRAHADVVLTPAGEGT